jgi:hypothetical protein
MGTTSVRKVARWLSDNKKRFGILAVGHTAKRIEEILLDWLLYGAVVITCTANWGPLWGSLAGFAIMAPVSAILSLGYIRLYDWAQTDWFGLEFLKGLRDETSRTSLLARVVRSGNVPAFFALSLYGDPFLTTIYLREGAGKYTNLAGRDWFLFWSSVIVSNAYWTLRWTAIAELARFLWTCMFGSGAS